MDGANVDDDLGREVTNDLLRSSEEEGGAERPFGRSCVPLGKGNSARRTAARSVVDGGAIRMPHLDCLSVEAPFAGTERCTIFVHDEDVPQRDPQRPR